MKLKIVNEPESVDEGMKCPLVSEEVWRWCVCGCTTMSETRLRRCERTE